MSCTICNQNAIASIIITLKNIADDQNGILEICTDCKNKIKIAGNENKFLILNSKIKNWLVQHG